MLETGEIFKQSISELMKYDSIKAHKFEKEYNDRINHDIPVIPKYVSEWLIRISSISGLGPNGLITIFSLSDSLKNPEIGYWIHQNSDLIALAWLLNKWREKGTNEIKTFDNQMSNFLKS